MNIATNLSLVVVSILLYGCTPWTLTKRLEKKLDGSYTRMLWAILNKSWWQHPTRHQLYGPLPPISKTIQVRWTRHAGHCWRSRDKLISDVLLWTPTYGQAKAGWPARTYIQQLCEDTGCSPEDLPEAMNDREKWQERVRDIRASGTTWWWWSLVLWRHLDMIALLYELQDSVHTFIWIFKKIKICFYFEKIQSFSLDTFQSHLIWLFYLISYQCSLAFHYSDTIKWRLFPFLYRNIVDIYMKIQFQFFIW